MDIEHPYLLAVACVLSLPATVAIGRLIFGSFARFLDDVGFGNNKERSFTVVYIGLTPYVLDPIFFFKVLGFGLGVAAVIAAIYHFLVLGSTWLA